MFNATDFLSADSLNALDADLTSTLANFTKISRIEVPTTNPTTQPTSEPSSQPTEFEVNNAQQTFFQTNAAIGVYVGGVVMFCFILGKYIHIRIKYCQVFR